MEKTYRKTKTIKKMVIGSYISRITLNVSRLNTPTKRLQTDWVDENMCMYALPLTTSLYLTLSPSSTELFSIIKLIILPLWLPIVIYLFCLAIDCEN